MSRAARIRRHDRALRRMVLRLRGCMGSLPRAERRVLLLRAGIGMNRTRTRRQVAHLTGMRPARVARLERRGLRQLRAVARTGSCAVGSGRASVAAGKAAAGGAPSSTGSAAAPGHADVLAEHWSGGPSENGSPEIQGSSLVPPLSQPLTGGGGGLGDYRDPLLAISIGVFVFAVLAEIRRGRAGR